MPGIELGDDFTHPNMSFVSAHFRCRHVEKDVMIQLSHKLTDMPLRKQLVNIRIIKASKSVLQTKPSPIFQQPSIPKLSMKASFPEVHSMIDSSSGHVGCILVTRPHVDALQSARRRFLLPSHLILTRPLRSDKLWRKCTSSFRVVHPTIKRRRKACVWLWSELNEELQSSTPPSSLGS